MRNIALRLQYDGSAYHGWQVQKTEVTVAETLEKALTKVCGHPVKAVGCGRTDAGVHARGQIGNFKCETSLLESEILNYINAYLPQDIRVLSLQTCGERFHSRLNAKSKRYSYTISVGKPSVFKRKYVYATDKMPSIEKMNDAAKLL